MSSVTNFDINISYKNEIGHRVTYFSFHPEANYVQSNSFQPKRNPHSIHWSLKTNHSNSNRPQTQERETPTSEACLRKIKKATVNNFKLSNENYLMKVQTSERMGALSLHPGHASTPFRRRIEPQPEHQLSNGENQCRTPSVYSSFRLYFIIITALWSTIHCIIAQLPATI